MKPISKTTILNHETCHRLASLESQPADSGCSESQHSQNFHAKQGRRVDTAAANFFDADSVKSHVTSEVLLSSFAPNKRFAQLTFSDNNAEIRVDIGWFDDDEKFHFIEVKSGLYSEKKIEYYLSDIAAQIAVIKHVRPNIEIGTVSLALLNPDARGKEDKALFIPTDVTDKVIKTANDININQIVKDISLPPAQTFCEYCKSCEYRTECFPQFPGKHSILDIPRLGYGKIKELFNQNILDAKNVPDGMLSDKQLIHVKTWRSGKLFINKKEIGNFLTKTDPNLRGGVHFLDFEAISPALPWFDNHNPYTLLPFQFALITIQPSGDMLRHDFLYDKQDDPSPHFADALIEKLCSDDFPIVIYSGYEKTVVKGLNARFPNKEKKLSLITKDDRFCDLLKCVRGDYIHPDANGESSIKVMLPICAPKMTYDSLNIKNGDDAVEGWDNYRNCQNTEERKKLRKDLIDYCHQDSLAMIKVLEKIRHDYREA